MKGCRKLAPGEVIREGDRSLLWGPTSPDNHYATIHIGEAVGEQDWFRKARTDGCPVGWRWADAGEAYAFSVGHDGKAYDCRGEFMGEADQFGAGCGVIYYPEDERLEE